MLRQERQVGGDGDVRFIAVRDHALAALLRDRGDAHEFGQAASHGHVGLGDVDLADFEGMLILVARGEAEIAAADRNAETLEPRVSLQIVDRQRRLDPEEIVVAEDRHQRQPILGLLPGRRRVHHQPDVRAHVIAGGADDGFRLADIQAPVRIGDDLDCLQAELQPAIDIAAHFVGRFAQGIDRSVSQQAIALPLAQQVSHRLALDLAADVPQGDVDGAHGMDDDAAPAVIAGPVIHPVPHGLDLQGVLSDHNLLQSHGMGVGARRGNDGADDRGNAVYLGDAGDAAIRVDENEAIVV